MQKFVLATVGTSIITSDAEHRKLFYSTETMRMGYFEEAPSTWVQALDAKMEAMRRPGRTPSISPACSAEINTLTDIGVGPGDEVALLASDNAAGRFCAVNIKEILCKNFGLKECDVSVERVEGLQVLDGKKLRTQGLGNFCECAYNLIKSHQYSHQVYINPTGGFKGVLPFLTVLGMLFSCRIVYKFETAEQMINLPSLPITLDQSLFMRAAKALQFAQDKVFFAKEDFLGQIQDFEYYEEHLFSSLIQPYEDLYQLTPLAECLVNQMEEYEPVMVSAPVLKQIDAMPEDKKQIAHTLLNKAGDCEWRKSHYHAVEGSDVTALKPGATTERLTGYETNGRFHVAYLYMCHDDYDREVSRTSLVTAKKLKYQEWTPQSPEPRVKFLWDKIHHLEEALQEARTKLISAESDKSKAQPSFHFSVEIPEYADELKALKADLQANIGNLRDEMLVNRKLRSIIDKNVPSAEQKKILNLQTSYVPPAEADNLPVFPQGLPIYHIRKIRNEKASILARTRNENTRLLSSVQEFKELMPDLYAQLEEWMPHYLK